MSGPYLEFPILEAARLSGLRLKERTLHKTEVEAWCPFCPTPSSDYHLYMNTQSNQWHCMKCGARGNSVTLYARIAGLDNRTAAERLRNACGISLSTPRPREPEVTTAPLHTRHDVYFDMLQMMTLSPAHTNNLLLRGLSAGRIQENLYRSMPPFSRRRQIAAELSKHYDLRGVPGFYWKEGRWELYGKEGILIPYLDRNGYIQGCQIRLEHPDNPKRRFRWLSSNPEYQTADGSLCYPMGTAASSWVHVTGDTLRDCAFITEGGLKGDIASWFLEDALFVCVPGVSSLGHLKRTLLGLPHLRRCMICFDMDMLSNQNVWGALRNLLELIERMGLPCQIASWTEYKGIDDALLMASLGNPVEFRWDTHPSFGLGQRAA